MGRHTRRSVRRRSRRRRSTSRAKRVRRSTSRSSTRVRYRSSSSQIPNVVTPSENVFRGTATPSLFTGTSKQYVPNTHNIYFMVPITPDNRQTWLAVNERRMALLRGMQDRTRKQPHITLFQIHFHPELPLEKVGEISTKLSELVPHILQDTVLTHQSDDFSILSSASVLESAFYAKEYFVIGPNLVHKLVGILGNPVNSDDKYAYFRSDGMLALAIPHFSLATLYGSGKFHISLFNFSDLRTYNPDTFHYIFEGVDETKTHVKDLREDQLNLILERVKAMEVPDTNVAAATNYAVFQASNPRQSDDPSKPRIMYMPFDHIALMDFKFNFNDNVKNSLGGKPGEPNPSSIASSTAAARLERSRERWSQK